MARLALVVGLMLVVALGGLRLSTVAYQRSCARAYPPQEFVTVDGVRLHYSSAGQGRTVVLLHGDGGSALDFTMSPVFDRLAHDYRVVALDRPGHGYSDPTPDAETLLGQAAHIRAAVRALGVVDPVLVGHSRGASVMAAYLDRYPGEVAAAVSLGGAMLADGDPPAYTLYRPGAWPVMGRLLTGTVYAPAVRWDDYALLRAGLDDAFAPETTAPDSYVEAFACQWAQPSTVRTTYRLAQDTYQQLPRISERYQELKVPAVIVHGDADANVNPADATRLHETIPVSLLRLLPGAGHEPQFTRPDDVIAAVHDAFALASGLPSSSARRRSPVSNAHLAIRLGGVQRSFGDVRALASVTLQVGAGEVVGL